MWNRKKDNKNQFIGRRTGQNILPSKKPLRKREDGIEIFQDYWTDSEEDNTCLIAEKHVTEPEVSSTLTEQNGKDINQDKNDGSPCKTVVTDTIEIETQELIYDSSNNNYGIHHKKKNFNQTITIQHMDNQNDNELLPDSTSTGNKIYYAPSNDLNSYNDANSCNPSASFTESSPSLKQRSRSFNKDSSYESRNNMDIANNNSDPQNSINDNEQNNLDVLSTSSTSVGSHGKKREVDMDNTKTDEETISEKTKLSKSRKNAQVKKKSSNNNSTVETEKNQNRSLDIIHEEHVSSLELQNQSMKKSQISLNTDENISQLPKKKKGKKRKNKPSSNEDLKTTDKENVHTLEADSTGIRRSSRQRHAPLKFWSNERLQYRYTKTGDIECLGVVRDSRGDQLIYDKALPKKKKITVEKHIKPRKPAQPAQSFVEKGIMVFDPESKEDVYANVVMPFNAIEWRSPKVRVPGKTYEVGKSYMLDNAAFGFLRLEAMQTKPMQYLPGYDAVFVVMTGKVEVCISRTSMLLSERDTFYLPRGNAYSVTNLLDSEALLSFTATHDSYLNELRKGE